MHPIEEAVARLETAVVRNRRRFQRRADVPSVVADLASLWARILQQILMSWERAPLAMANQLTRDRGTVLASRVA